MKRRRDKRRVPTRSIRPRSSRSSIGAPCSESGQRPRSGGALADLADKTKAHSLAADNTDCRQRSFLGSVETKALPGRRQSNLAAPGQLYSKSKRAVSPEGNCRRAFPRMPGYGRLWTCYMADAACCSPLPGRARYVRGATTSVVDLKLAATRNALASGVGSLRAESSQPMQTECLATYTWPTGLIVRFCRKNAWVSADSHICDRASVGSRRS